MNAPFYVEILSRNGEVRYRQRVEKLPIRIGRGYDNDVILDDRHTSAHHVAIERNEAGRLEVHNLSSRNGVVHKGKHSECLSIDGNTVFRLGHTSLRVRSADFSVADEMRDTTFHGWEGWPPMLTGVVLLTLFSLYDTWLTDADKMEAIHYITALVSLLIFGLLWSGGWTLANRIFAGQTRFGRHIFIAACGILVIELVSQTLSLVAYSLSLETLSHYRSHVLIAIAAGMVYFHLLTISPGNARRHAVTSAILLLAGSGLALAFNYQNRGVFSDEPYMSKLYPPAVRLTSDHTIDQFLAESKRLKSDIDAERAALLSEDGEDDLEEFD